MNAVELDRALLPAEDEVASSRASVLDAAARDAAEAWTRQLVDALRLEGRPITGGWPGTINEARGRCGALAARRLAAHQMPALARTELGDLTRAAYDEARRLWRLGDTAR